MAASAHEKRLESTRDEYTPLRQYSHDQSSTPIGRSNTNGYTRATLNMSVVGTSERM